MLLRNIFTSLFLPNLNGSPVPNFKGSSMVLSKWPSRAGIKQKLFHDPTQKKKSFLKCSHKDYLCAPPYRTKVSRYKLISTRFLLLFLKYIYNLIPSTRTSNEHPVKNKKSNGQVNGTHIGSYLCFFFILKTRYPIQLDLILFWFITFFFFPVTIVYNSPWKWFWNTTFKHRAWVICL